MKFELQDKSLTIQTETLRAFCMKCGKYLGSAEAIKETISTNYHLMYPVCGDCFRETGWKIATPDVDPKTIMSF